MGAEYLSDREIRSLIRVYSDLANASGLSPMFVAWYSSLALELLEVFLRREKR